MKFAFNEKKIPPHLFYILYEISLMNKLQEVVMEEHRFGNQTMSTNVVMSKPSTIHFSKWNCSPEI